MPLTRDDVTEIYTLDHPNYQCVPTVVDGPDQFWVTGTIITGPGQTAGSFIRSLVKRDGELTAVHDLIRVHEPFRRQGIAKSHYKKAFRRYLEIGCYRVEMFAVEYGVFVWPGFGFRYRWGTDKADVQAAISELYEIEASEPIPFVPDEEFAMILTQTPGGAEVGVAAAQRTASRHINNGLEMVLDLRDQATITYLSQSGILDP